MFVIGFFLLQAIFATAVNNIDRLVMNDVALLTWLEKRSVGARDERCSPQFCLQ